MQEKERLFLAVAVAGWCAHAHEAAALDERPQTLLAHILYQQQLSSKTVHRVWEIT